MQKRTYREVTVEKPLPTPASRPRVLGPPRSLRLRRAAGPGGWARAGPPGYSPSTVARSARAATPLTRGGRRALGTRVPTGKGPSLATSRRGMEGGALCCPVSHPPPCLSGEAVSVTTSSWPLAGRSGPVLGNGLWAKATD